jgi:hypothetical protein
VLDLLTRLAPDLDLLQSQELSFEPNIAFRGLRELWLRLSTRRTSSGYSPTDVPDSGCHSASIERVLPPPKLVCRFHTGDAFLSPPTRRTAP